MNFRGVPPLSTRRIALAAILVAALAASPARPQDAAPADESALRRRFQEAPESERADLAVRLARLAEADGRWSEAASWWRQARRLRGAPADLEGESLALLAFAQEVAAQGEPATSVAAAAADARAAIERARAAGVRTVDLSLGLAVSWAMGGDRDASVAALVAAGEEFPDDPRPRRALAAAWADMGRHPEAIAVLAKLSAASPADADLALELASVAREGGDEAVHREAALRAIRAAPEDARGWAALWTVYSPKQRWGELADAVLAAAAEHPDGVAAAHYAGMACADARRFDDALAWLEKAWTRSPGDLAAKLRAARILLSDRPDRARAVRLYEEVLAADPQNAEATTNLSWLAIRLSDEGKPGEAVPVFAIVARARAADGRAQADLALALRWAGRYEESEKTYLAAIAIAPEDAQIRNDYALMLLVQRREADAVRVLREGTLVDPRHNDCIENLAFVARARGQRDEALRWFRAAHAAALARGEDGRRHRLTVDDQRWPLPPLSGPR